MSKHTAGPWAIKWDFNVYGPDRNYPGSDRMVANAGSHSNSKFSSEVTAENHANARLIAAAPEMLDALLAIRAAFKSGCAMFPAQDLAERAIAKAEADD